MSKAPETVFLLDSVTTTGAGAGVRRRDPRSTFQAVGSVSASTGAASIDVEISNNGVNWKTVGTISLTLGTSKTSDGFALDAPWVFVRGNVTSISGTDATVSLLMGV